MRDCPNADVRDLLPDLVHGTLPPEVQAAVLEHVSVCGDCTAERELLARLVAARPEPAVDVQAIGAAVTRVRTMAPRSSAGPLASRRRRAPAVGWRAAAVIAAVSLGALAVGSTQRDRDPAPVAPAQALVPAPAPGHSLGMPLADVSETELQALLGALETLEPVPAEPEPLDDILGGLS